MNLVIKCLALFLLVTLAFLGSAGPAASEETPRAPQGLWQFEGYASMLDAARQAKGEQRRLLVGLSGGAT